MLRLLFYSYFLFLFWNMSNRFYISGKNTARWTACRHTRLISSTFMCVWALITLLFCTASWLCCLKLCFSNFWLCKIQIFNVSTFSSFHIFWKKQINKFYSNLNHSNWNDIKLSWVIQGIWRGCGVFSLKDIVIDERCSGTGVLLWGCSYHP